MSTSLAAVASLASNDLVKSVLGPFAAKAGANILGLTKEKWRKYTLSFEHYLAEAESRHKYFSSQVFANEGQLLENYYIPLTLQKEGSTNVRSTIVVNSYPADLISAYKDVLIVDTAGMGKSTLLKFIFLKSIKAAASIPIFIELRKLSKERTILAFICEELKIANDETGLKILEQCLLGGLFTFFLDGFDEIADVDKQVVSSQIIDLKARASGNKFIMSSREEHSLAYLVEFHRFRIKPLDEEEAFALIRKISPDTKIAASLIEKVQEKAQGNLKEFLANPLLVSLLVKSFLHSPILPVRLSEFYRQVFDALFQTHDAKKELGGYSRKKKSNLDLDRFHKAMRSLGVLTYKDSKLEFTTDELLVYIEKVKVLTSDSGYSASNFRHDLLHAVPLFVQEGAISRWAHRSLQEYFAAAYICVDAKEKQALLLLQLYEAGLEKNANLLRLCADIDGKTFKHILVKRYLEEHLSAIDASFSKKDFPNIPDALLKQRRSIIQRSPAALLVLPRSVSRSAYRNYLHSIEEETREARGIVPLSTKGTIMQTPSEKVKFLLAISLSDNSTMDAIIRTYYHERIAIRSAGKPIRRNLKNVDPHKFFTFDADTRNPLNSDENFEISLQILLNISQYLHIEYDIDRMRRLYDNVLRREQDSSRLDISFG